MSSISPITATVDRIYGAIDDANTPAPIDQLRTALGPSYRVPPLCPLADRVALVSPPAQTSSPPTPNSAATLPFDVFFHFPEGTPPDVCERENARTFSFLVSNKTLFPRLNPRGIPEPTEEVAARVMQIIAKTFAFGSSFPIWLNWIATMNILLRRDFPKEAEMWPSLCRSLKNAMPRDVSELSLPREAMAFFDSCRNITRKRLEHLYRTIHQSNKTHRQDLLDLLVMCENDLYQQSLLYPSKHFGKNFGTDLPHHKQLKEFLEFIYETKAEIDTISDKQSRYKWHKLLPEDPKKLHASHRKCMTAMAASFGDFSFGWQGNLEEFGPQRNYLGAREKTLNPAGKLVPNHQLNNTSKRDRIAMVTESVYAGFAPVQIYLDTLCTFMAYFSQNGDLDYLELLEFIRELAGRVFVHCITNRKSTGNQLTFEYEDKTTKSVFLIYRERDQIDDLYAEYQTNQHEAMEALFQKLETEHHVKITPQLWELFKAIQRTAANLVVLEKIHPFSKLSNINNLLSYTFLDLLRKRKAFELLSFLHFSIDNMESEVFAKLNALKVRSLDCLSEIFQKIPVETWKNHQPAILSCLQEMYLIAAEPVLHFTQFIFGLSLMGRENSPVTIIATEESTQEKPSAASDPARKEMLVEDTQETSLAHMLDFASAAKKKLKSLRQKAASSQKALSATAAAAPTVLPLLQITAPTNSVSAALLEKEAALAAAASALPKAAKVKTRKAPPIESASAATAAQEKEPETVSTSTATAAANDGSEDSIYTSNPRLLKKGLRERGFTLWVEGGSHTKAINPTTGQRTTVPRHGTIASGTAASIDRKTKNS